ncbi:MAG: DUF1559 domain-containing protein [Abitibacteriaceae bacterium]|nr:DUF1559 domain-containing protein [Abditibacteriaceae bacterium]
MRDERYVSVGDDVYIDQQGPRRFPWRWVIGFCAAAVALVTVFGALVDRAPAYARRAACQSNLKQIALALRQYEQDYERFPSVRSSSIADVKGAAPSAHLFYGWADSIQPYVRSLAIYQCPAEPTPSNPDPTQFGYTDYWFNMRLSSFEYKRLTQPDRTVLLGDGNSSDARNGVYDLPPHWYSINGGPIHSDDKSPVYRHLGGANYAFADGHVKWLRPTQFREVPGAYYTFHAQPFGLAGGPPWGQW